ncbi:MAG: chemotaxis protein CheC [Candidatus Omnitrophota bacterium]|nr:chemotaxis protein CheC [Candidatus Omnitrophota bacterium]
MVDLNFSPIQLDALREIGNVGAGNAATALGQLMNKIVSINIPEVKFLRLDQLDDTEFFKEPQEISIAICSRILGTLRGGALVLFSKKSSLLLSDILMKRKPGSSELLTLIELSAISETAYILCCSYLDSVGEMLNHRLLIPSSPQTAIDKMNNLNKVLIKKFIGEDVKYIMSIENKMCIENIEIDLFVTLLLEYASTKKIFEMLGL